MEYSKRQSQQEGTDDQKGIQIRGQDSKRRREDSQQSDTLRIISLRSLVHITNDDIARYMKDLVQRLVREELAECKLPRPINNNQIGISGSKPFRLVFKNELPDTIYTNSKIKAKGNTPLEVVLFDIESKSIVAEGSLSSIKIEICVLDGEFCSINGREDWSEDEFNAKIVRQRDNKGRLLKGDTIITLENGVGYITNLEFTDNSSWRRTRCFSLGAKLLQSNLKDAINIREGRTKPFIAKDFRGEKNQKRDTPSLNDETWRLKHISKNVYRRLLKHGIKTVGDLLKENETNPSSLQEISKKKQEEIIKLAKKAKYAKTCVAEATFDGQNYHSEKNTLISNQREAYKNLKDPVPIETITHELVKTLTPVNAQYYSAPNQDVQQLDFSIAQQEEISRLNWSAGGQIVDGYILSQIDDENVSNFLPEINSEFIFPYGDEAEYCNSSSFPNSALNISDKGKSKMV
ncbi:calmodulin-binding protein 60 E-like isoform X2 [Glycine soja]|uniref:calmodulin-binding protein 60 E-like isoform X2 n=1 Tax=Glycine soja TaxID=3848 RepID=UPI00103F8E8A|nr:calmodulin-binding protein 60 E-like isoform X2 [Glycine soja]